MTHTCHWPGCTAPVPPRLWGCKYHWQKLPRSIRNRILAAYVKGQEITKTPSLEYIAASKQAREWIVTNSVELHNLANVYAAQRIAHLQKENPDITAMELRTRVRVDVKSFIEQYVSEFEG